LSAMKSAFSTLNMSLLLLRVRAVGPDVDRAA
jgi:hypothetical protein